MHKLEYKVKGCLNFFFIYNKFTIELDSFIGIVKASGNPISKESALAEAGKSVLTSSIFHG